MKPLTIETSHGKRVKYLSREGFTISNLVDVHDTNFFVIANKQTGKFHSLHIAIPEMVRLHPPLGLARGDKIMYKPARGKEKYGIVAGISIGLDSVAVVTDNFNEWQAQPTKNISLERVKPGWK